MGKSYSRQQDNNGDAQVNVYNALEAHSEDHEGHDIKLWIILVLLAILLHREYARRLKKRAIVSAKSMARLNEVESKK